ncbi:MULTISPECIES: anti-sigma factor family protein [unclassified Sphingobium]|uniref:anti-sigma factor family protein n=1 Tax=unclassified Sphingobium TaxID=2611147 RepID=UPI000D173C17|nr:MULTISPECIES: anti-sigma factor [unclassified Sphingobium]MBG6120242.1 hypothetical protein [Sphingobium sp. JAI105]PSO09947.1 anti-sigma factor [Sphingobium sp. AEW4]TWD00104.1 hypothetical protein FB595_1208 [Sphingobium sp. AEW010]TWD19261.1 hypothetical protein FB596_12057 [Sphingobium sp. AEW013]TWD22074.1 hypothetical protein FB594_1208 [Sphingobium sp. AEW001]
MTDEEAIFAYIDGELDGEECVRIEGMIEADPALQAMVAEHRALAGRLQSGFSTILEAPIPAALLAPPSGGAEVSSLAAARTRREQRRAAWNMSHWGAMAATLVAGVIGGAIFTGGREGPVVEQGRKLVASGRLEHALDTQLASTQGANAPVRIALTFKNHGGAICRSFTGEAAQGVACREGKAWQLQGRLAPENGRTGDYRMAASSGTAELVDRLIAGDAFDQAQERAALAAKWAPPKAR